MHNNDINKNKTITFDNQVNTHDEAKQGGIVNVQHNQVKSIFE